MRWFTKPGCWQDGQKYWMWDTVMNQGAWISWDNVEYSKSSWSLGEIVERTTHRGDGVIEIPDPFSDVRVTEGL